MSEEVAIRVEHLSKRFRRGGSGVLYYSLRDSIARRLRSPFAKRPDDWFWSLEDVSMEIRRGEVIGIIGRNGAGKSTLLKILSRILRPTSGRAEIHGRVGSLLEVGTGFHYELTGRENLYLYGAILGMSRAEIARKYEDIVEFAGVRDSIDSPLKHFSSGMQMRLAFAVAAHLEPEILLVDEVLAVGDAEFQKRCLGKMKDVSSGGRTVLFVSHQMNHLRRLCDRVYWLDEGRVKMVGPTNEVINAYEAAMASAGPAASRARTDDFAFLDWSVDSGEGPGNVVGRHGPLVFDVHVEAFTPIRRGQLVAVLRSSGGDRMWSIWHDGIALPQGAHRMRFTVPSLPLMPGAYQWQLRFQDDRHWTDWWWPPRPLLVEATPIPQHSEENSGILNVPWDYALERVK